MKTYKDADVFEVFGDPELTGLPIWATVINGKTVMVCTKNVPNEWVPVTGMPAFAAESVARAFKRLSQTASEKETMRTLLEQLQGSAPKEPPKTVAPEQRWVVRKEFASPGGQVCVNGLPIERVVDVQVESSPVFTGVPVLVLKVAAADLDFKVIPPGQVPAAQTFYTGSEPKAPPPSDTAFEELIHAFTRKNGLTW